MRPSPNPRSVVTDHLNRAARVATGSAEEHVLDHGLRAHFAHAVDRGPAFVPGREPDAAAVAEDGLCRGAWTRVTIARLLTIITPTPLEIYGIHSPIYSQQYVLGYHLELVHEEPAEEAVDAAELEEGLVLHDAVLHVRLVLVVDDVDLARAALRRADPRLNNPRRALY